MKADEREEQLWSALSVACKEVVRLRSQLDNLREYYAEVLGESDEARPNFSVGLAILRIANGKPDDWDIAEAAKSVPPGER